MAKIREVFNQLVDQTTIKIKTGSIKAHDSLRTRLVKLYSSHKKLLDSIGVVDDSGTFGVSANFDSDKGISTFHLRVPRSRFEGKIDYQIVEEQPSGV